MRGTHANARKGWGWPIWVVGFLALVALGTFTVLSTVKHFFGTHQVDFITLDEIHALKFEHVLPYNASLTAEEALAEEQRSGLQREKIPRIVHQTWKSDALPERWVAVRKDCMRMLPDYEFKLWTDAGSREFIQKEYPSFLATWDSYPYNIQRADAIRYFVLHKFGGIYMDLDIGCRAHPGPLMHFESILPVTKPVGVSNDLLFSAPATPFMDLAINSLETFNHEWLWMNYPTVMFSTGPMFISAIYSMWSRILDRGVGISELHRDRRVRIMPKALYGKNALPEDVPESFFWHYYGSSWHAKDAGFIGFLGKYGYNLLVIGSSFVFVGFCYILWSKRQYLPFSPKARKHLLEPFHSLSDPPAYPDGSPQDAILAPIQKVWYSITSSLRPVARDEIAYTPLPTNGDIATHSRSQSIDTDAISLHSVYDNPATNGYKIRPHHPVTKKPVGRARSRDVERGSPVAGKYSSIQGWPWSLPAALPSYSPAPHLVAGVKHPLRTDSPSSTDSDAESAVVAHTQMPNSSQRGPPTSPYIPQLLQPLPRKERKLSDGESELEDLLTDLEPVISATTARGATTPRDVINDPFQAMRKRSMSSEGDRFYRENGILPGTTRSGTSSYKQH